MTRSEGSLKGSLKGSGRWSWDGESAVRTTVGVRNHDPRVSQAPSYSFGSRYYEKPRMGPGPQYSQTMIGAGGSPSYTMGARPKRSIFDTEASLTPGPNAYAVQSSPWSERRAPMYSFGHPYSDDSLLPTPAPNTYSVPTTLGARVPHLRGAPASSILGKGSYTKSFSYDNAQTPGPARYGPVSLSCTTKRAPVVTLTGRTKLPPIKLVTPGPGAYNPGNSGVKASPRYSMGIRHGENVKPLFTLADVAE